MSEQIIIFGKNLEKLKGYPDNYFDSIVTDSPYGLGEEPDANEVLKDWLEKGVHEVKSKGGFMGKEWDAFVPQPLFWKECYRVLKPGGYLLSFFGTRTYDWGTMAIRLAGFEIRNQIQWLYACVSDDTEVLTKLGFKMLYELIDGEQICIYDKDTDSYKWEAPEKWNVYSIKDTAYRIQSDNTDQIVSRNHRCLIERKGTLLFEVAENLSQERETSVPFLEKLPLLQEYIPNKHEGASYKEQKLFGRMSSEVGGGKTVASDYLFNGEKLRTLRQAISDEKKQAISLLQQKMQWSSEAKKLSSSCAQRWEESNRKEIAAIEGANDRKCESFLEGWGNIQEKEGILQRSQNKVCEMPEGIFEYEQDGWICDGVQIDNGKTSRQRVDKSGSSSSYRPQPYEQCNNQSNVVQEQHRPQEVRVGASYRTTMATVTPFEYSGIVFCPTVSTGAFVARRNGKIFVTGNTGFPKSLDVSLAIDKQAGAVREVIGEGKWNARKVNGSLSDSSVGLTTKSDFKETAPSTDDAKKWDGWGTDLKPANEPIVVARKPLSEKTVAANVLKHGTGGINIDACRIFTDELTPRNNNNTESLLKKGFEGEPKIIEPSPLGRFPANLILGCPCEIEEHEEGCPVKELDRQSGVTKSIQSSRGVGLTGSNVYGKGQADYDTVRGHEDEGGASRFFFVAKPSDWERQRGLNKFIAKDPASVTDFRPTLKSNPENWANGTETPYTRTTAKKNNHPTVKPVSLMRYLVKLVTPKGGICLDPFNGSGTTGIACKLEGINYVGIEQDDYNCQISEARIKSWTNTDQQNLFDL